ncbi:nitroreductase [Paenibacillus sp. GCM10012303]|uniref:nitroreductase family protein n=1 Tax=Paenibacillus sp. GCM10012303 TaxID=3317340 RepID=UPI003614001D
MTTSAFQTADTIRAWRPTREFQPAPVSEELIGELLNVAVWTPSPGQREPWRFLLFMGDGKRTITEAIVRNGVKKRDPEKLMSVPAYLMVVTGPSDGEKPLQSDQDYAAACSLIQNFRLAAWERGLGVTWVMKPFAYRPEFLAECGVSPGERLAGLLQIGYPDAVPDAPTPSPAQHKWTVIHSAQTTEASGIYDERNDSAD